MLWLGIVCIYYSQALFCTCHVCAVCGLDLGSPTVPFLPPTACARYECSSHLSSCDRFQPVQLMPIWQFSDRVIATEFLAASCANLQSQMLSESCWRETSFVSASQDRRQSFQSVSLATNTVAGLSDRHSAFVCRSLPGRRINLTNWRTPLVISQPLEVHFPYSDVRVRVNRSPGSSSRCRRGWDPSPSFTFAPTVHWQVPAIVDVAETFHCRPWSWKRVTRKVQSWSTFWRTTVVVVGRRASRHHCQHYFRVSVFWTSVAVAGCHVLVAIVEEREISHADLRFTALPCSVLAAALPLSPFPFSPRISS